METKEAGRLLARSAADLDADWARRVVAAHAPGARVASVETLSREVGTTTRVRLAVDHDAPLPRRWLVKLPSASWRARAITALPRLLATENRFYREIAPALPVPCPRALAAAGRRFRGTTLVLADVTEAGAAAVGRPGDTFTAEQAAAVVELLARLHAWRWEHPALDRELAWLAAPVRRLEDRIASLLAVPLMRRGLRRAGAAVPARLHAPALGYARRRRQVMQLLDRGPRTLVHHDCHPGNLYWTGDGPGLLDWQLVRIGEGVGDVAYLLATALEPETRRRSEDDLLARYARALEARGITPPGPAPLRTRYRAHLTYAFEAMVVTLAVGGLMPAAVASKLVQRTAAAVEDHAAFAALEML